MLAPDRRTFLRTAGRLAVGVATLNVARSEGASPPPPGAGAKAEDGLKPLDGDGLLATPAGAVRRLGDAKMRIQSHINALQFSPRGTTLVSATSGELRGWDPRNGKVLFRLAFPGEASIDSGRLTSRDTFALMVRPNSGGNQELRHYAFGTGKQVSRSPALKIENTQHTAFSVDGSRVAVVHNESLCLLDATTGAEKWRESLPAEAVGDCRFFPDGATVAVAAKGEVKLFAATTGKLGGTLKAVLGGEKAKGAAGDGKGRDWVSDLAVSVDGKWVAASVGEDEELVLCWDVKSAAIKHQLKPAAKPIGFSPDGSELATVHGGAVTFWTMASGKAARQFPVPRGDVLLSPDGKMLAISAGDSAILIDAITGKHLPHSADPPGVPSTIRFVGPNRLQGRLDEWGGWVEWDVITGARTLIQPPGVSGLVPVALSADGRVALYRKESDYTARDMATGKVLRSGKGADDVNDPVTTLAITPDGQALVSPVEEGLAVVTDKGRRVIARKGFAPGMATTVVTDGRIAAIGYRGSENGSPIDLYDLAADRLIRRLIVDGDPGQLVFSPDGARLAIAHDTGRDGRHGQQGTIDIFDVVTGKSIFRAEPDNLYRQHVIAFSPDCRMLARLGNAGQVQVWEVTSGQVRAGIEFGKDADINALAFSPDARTLAVSVSGGPVFLWDLFAAPKPELSGFDLSCAWEVMRTGDATPVFDAIRWMIQVPALAIPFLGAKVSPVEPPDPKVVDQYIADLDHKEFRKREAAARSLAELGERAHEPMIKALTANPTPEVRERLERLLAAGERSTPEQLQRLRAVEVVEMIGTPEAMKLLTHGASGAPGALLTVEAAAAAKRVAERVK